MLSFGIIASSAVTGAGVTNWEFFLPTSTNDYAQIGFGNGTAVVQGVGGDRSLGWSTAVTASITAGGSVTTGDAGIFFNNGIWHIPGNVTDTHRIAFSTNGTSWGTALNVTAQTGDDITDIAYNGTIWAAPVFNDNDVYTSTTGTAFTMQTAVLASGNWTDITWNGSVFGVYQSYRFFDTPSTTYYTSTNGTTWTVRTLPASPYSPVVAGSGVVLYAGSAGVMYNSTTGTAFSVVGTAPTSLWYTNIAESKLAFGSGVWVYAGKPSGGGTVLSYYSTNNGATWATATFSTPITTSNYDLAYDSTSNAFYMIADGGTVSNIYKASITA